MLSSVIAQNLLESQDQRLLDARKAAIALSLWVICHAIVATANIKIPRVLVVVVAWLPATIPHPSTIRLPLAVLEIVLAIRLQIRDLSGPTWRSNTRK